jgi:diguanylate cyclase (GGDEF)-like protein/PAS domain S-box-containing protein
MSGEVYMMVGLDSINSDNRCVEEKYQEMFNNAPLGVFRSSFDGRFLDVNPRMAELLGYENPAQVLADCEDLGNEIYEDPSLRAQVLEKLRERGSYSFEGRFRDFYGEFRDVEIHLRIVKNEDGEPLYIEGLSADITSRKQAERELIRKQKELEESDRKYRTLFDSAADAIFVFDGKGRIRDANKIACERLGYTYEELLGMSYVEINQADYVPRLREWLPRILESEEPFTARTEHVCRDGKVIPTEMNARTITLASGPSIICIARDITNRLEAENALRRSREIIEQEVFDRTAQLKQANERLHEEIAQRIENEERIRVLAMYDPLTGLPNRALIMDRLVHTAAWVERTDGTAALLYLDLNDFKIINDKYGHQAGDQALRQVAERLKLCLREVDTAGRIGGDEFVILLQNLARREDVELVVDRLLGTMKEPVLLDGQAYHGLGISVGICFCPRHGLDVDTLIRRADQAMYDAKSSGIITFRYCEEDFTDE